MCVEKLNVIDIFAGCGGLSEGFMKAGGFNFCGFVEWNKPCCETLALNLKNKWGDKEADKKVIRFDIQKTKELLLGWTEKSGYELQHYSSSGIGKIRDDCGSVDIIIGGPPCQAYSIAGRIRDENGMEDDYRNYLFESFIDVVEFFKPDLFIFENVVGMLSAAPGGKPVTERIKKVFNAHGYEIVDDLRKYAVLNTADYGVPQNRKRIIIVALNKKKFNAHSQEILKQFYTQIMPSLKIGKITTVRSAIGDFPKFFPNKSPTLAKKTPYVPTTSSLPNHYPRFHNRRDIKIFRELAKDAQNGQKKYSDASALKNLYTKKTGRTSSLHKYHVLKWNEPSTAIVAHLHKDGLRHIHPDFEQARSITVREAAKLQSFDNEFSFSGSQSDQYRMIGDAVPPLFAKAVAEGVKILVRNAGKIKEF